VEANKPGTVKQIFTHATKYDLNPDSSKREAGFLNIELMKQKVPKYVEYLSVLHGDKWEQTVSETKTMMLRMGSNPELNEERLKRINIDCLISVGELDKMVSVDETQKLANGIANASLCIWKETEHPIEKVDVEMISKEINRFFLN